jgi:hypothetical protein
MAEMENDAARAKASSGVMKSSSPNVKGFSGPTRVQNDGKIDHPLCAARVRAAFLAAAERTDGPLVRTAFRAA